MAAGGPGVSVLAPNGRRQTVKVTARTPLLQVLEEVCRKQNFNPREYSLKFQRTVLDLSLQWRFANLPNNASLEMVKCSQERVGAECTKVRVAVQLEDGVRLQHEFLASQTLWDIVTHFQQTRTCVQQAAPGSSPVCIYMRDEVTGESSLKKTSLQSLGLTGGSAIIRFVMRTSDKSEIRLPLSGQTAPASQVKIPVKEETREKPTAQVEKHDDFPTRTLDEMQTTLLVKERTVPIQCKEEGDKPAKLKKEQKSTSVSRQEHTEKPVDFVAPVLSGVQEVGAEVAVPNSSNTSSLRKDQQKQENGAISCPVLSHSIGSPHPPANSYIAPFIPFQGGGHRLGGANIPTGPSEADVPCAKAQEPIRSPGPSKPKKSRTSDEEDAESQPVDRNQIVCHIDSEQQVAYETDEPTDEFFEVTVDDVRRRFAQLKSERQRIEESPLLTKALRDAHVKEKLERYPKVVLRVLFPDRYILQGFFSPTETVGAVKDFVRSHLEDAELPFYLFITPPRTELKENSQTLFQAELFPAALVHFGSQTQRDHYLRRQLLEASVSPSQADILVARSMPRVPGPSPAPALSTLTDLNPVGQPRAPVSSADQDDEPVRDHQRPAQTDVGKVPKWLKLPGKK